MNAVAQIEAPSVISTMAQHYGMDRKAFESTLRSTVMPQGTSNEQAAAFLLVAREHNLNPFTREIFAFPAKGGGIQPVVSVDGWLKLINSHPQANGMEYKDAVDSNGQLTAITCRIFRKDREHAIEVTEYMSECRRETDTWKRWPARMLRHKATIQAARYAFGFAGIMEPDEAERADEVHVSQTFGEQHIPRAEIADERKARCAAAAEQYAGAVSYIKEQLALEDPDAYGVAEAWREIPQAAQMDLWLAPTKGGIFTTAERDYIKTKLPAKEVE